MGEKRTRSRITALGVAVALGAGACGGENVRGGHNAVVTSPAPLVKDVVGTPDRLPQCGDFESNSYVLEPNQQRNAAGALDLAPNALALALTGTVVCDVRVLDFQQVDVAGNLGAGDYVHPRCATLDSTPPGDAHGRVQLVCASSNS